MNKTITVCNGNKLIHKFVIIDTGYFHMRYHMLKPSGVLSVIPKSKFLRIINEARARGYTVKEE